LAADHCPYQVKTVINDKEGLSKIIAKIIKGSVVCTALSFADNASA
jgi:hypothetical protein